MKAEERFVRIFATLTAQVEDAEGRECERRSSNWREAKAEDRSHFLSKKQLQCLNTCELERVALE